MPFQVPFKGPDEPFKGLAWEESAQVANSANYKYVDSLGNFVSMGSFNNKTLTDARNRQNMLDLNNFKTFDEMKTDNVGNMLNTPSGT